jgi:hypothetical protein
VALPGTQQGPEQVAQPPQRPDFAGAARSRTGVLQHGLDVRILGREKTLYSVYRKMDLKHLSFAQVTDIYGFRIVLPELLDCYSALGILHQLYKPCRASSATTSPSRR